jgi:glycosyltransferase involved in cell wall biosynthesis
MTEARDLGSHHGSEQRESQRPCADIAVVIITFNEAANLGHALQSVAGWSNETYVLDSLSTDATVEIAHRFGVQTFQHPFEDYARQRNYALDNLPIRSEWILFLDADEWLSEETKATISAVIQGSPVENGFFLTYRLIWMGRWIRRGYYPTWILRLFRKGKARCDDRAINEHMIVDGATARLHCDLMHEDRKGISAWVRKHNEYASGEAREMFRSRTDRESQEIDASLLGSQAQRKRWVRYFVWNRLPPIVRPLFYFTYRYVLRFGFLDGMPAFVFHFLHGLWYPMLIDIKYLELRRAQASGQVQAESEGRVEDAIGGKIGEESR